MSTGFVSGRECKIICLPGEKKLYLSKRPYAFVSVWVARFIWPKHFIKFEIESRSLPKSVGEEKRNFERDCERVRLKQTISTKVRGWNGGTRQFDVLPIHHLRKGTDQKR